MKYYDPEKSITENLEQITGPIGFYFGEPILTPECPNGDGDGNV